MGLAPSTRLIGGVLRCLLAVAAAACLLAPAASADTTRVREIASVALHPWRMEAGERPAVPLLRDPAQRERTFAELEALGIRHARVDLSWLEVEPGGQGITDQLTRDWSTFDAIVQTAAAHGVELTPVVSYVPGWANGGAHYFTSPLEMQKFQTFFAAVLARYPQIKSWEIWNEPNYSAFARPTPDVGRFVDLLRAADAARDATGSQAKLVSGGLASVGEIDMFRFLDEMIARGALDYVDGIGVHPYGTAAPDNPKSLFLRLRSIHQRLVRAGRGDLKLWLTEYGAPDSTRTSGYGPASDEEGQAARLRKAYALAAGWDWIANLTWYELVDDCADASDPECRLGLLRPDFTRKRSALALRDLLAGGSPAKLTTRMSLRLAGERARVAARAVHHGRRPGSRVFRARGTVFIPALEGTGGKVAVRIVRVRSGRRLTRSFSGPIRAGRFDVRLGRLAAGRYRVRASYRGDSRYAGSSRTRVLVVPRQRVCRARVKPRARSSARPRCSRSP
jgi:hypothetical protein